MTHYVCVISVDRVTAAAVTAGGGIEAIIEATGFKTRENDATRATAAERAAPG